MPKFYRQNKKRIDPRYFLNETVLREQDEEDILKDAQKLKAAGGDWNKVKSTYFMIPGRFKLFSFAQSRAMS